jgi:hypothetical protein
MSDQGRRIEFGDKGPYLFQTLDVEPQATLLDEHDVCLFQFGQLYLPVAVLACKPLADALSNLSTADMGPEREGMIPLDFDLSETTELPLVTAAAGESFQHGETVFMDVFFGDTSARLCFSVPTAAVVGQVLSQVPSS